MKTLFLVRHAKSSWDYPELSDFERPLNKRGEKDSPEMGKRLRNKGILPDLMISSPANRALTTCKNVAKEIGYHESKIVTDKLIYHGGENTLLRIIQNFDNTFNTVLMFGHNPGFTDFANELANTDIYNIPTSGVFACNFDVSNWREIDFGTGKFIFFDYPKNK